MSITSALKSWPVVRVFSKDKLVDSPLLNRLGVQPFRVWLANAIYHAKSYPVDASVAEPVERLMQEGLIMIEDFLPDDEFRRLNDECRQFVAAGQFATSKRVGSNTIYNHDVRDLDRETYPVTTSLLHHPMLQKLFSAADRRRVNPANDDLVILIQYLVQGEGDEVDIETELHVDTFFNTFKAWLYLDDVRMENGPFVYVKGSQSTLRGNRYRKVYDYSQQRGVSGSRRVSQEELSEMGLSETTVLCKNNTLAMANTFGFHRRLRGVAGNDRLTIAITSKRKFL